MNLSDLIPWGRGRSDLSTRDADPFFALQGRMNQLFDDFFRGFEGSPLGAFSRGGLSVDVVETAEEYRVEAELPGVDEKDVHVSLTGDVLSIEGEKKSESRSEKEGNLRRERTYGRFERRLALGRQVDEDKIAATFKNGLLAVTLPKTEKARANVKRITIDSAK